jgi:Protein tyrosine and serine/threonine kinase
MEEVQTVVTPKHRLRTLNRVGRGAFGIVHRGTYDEAVVAVKTIAAQCDEATAERAYHMFAREAAILQDCNHE